MIQRMICAFACSHTWRNDLNIKSTSRPLTSRDRTTTLTAETNIDLRLRCQRRLQQVHRRKDEQSSDTVVETNHVYGGTSKYRHVIQCE